VRPKTSWSGLICRTHQYYRRQWLPNTEWSNAGDQPEQEIHGYACHKQYNLLQVYKPEDNGSCGRSPSVELSSLSAQEHEMENWTW